MRTGIQAAGQHTSAADHHAQAAQSHREASRHFKIGKDFAHAAHQALVAHGHALHALTHGRNAIDLYAAQEGRPVPSYLSRLVDRSLSKEVAAPLHLDGAAHHDTAADHHDAAAKHHEDAAGHADADHLVRALHSAKSALDHACHALYHGNQAAMHHVEFLGSAAVPWQGQAAARPADPRRHRSNGAAPVILDGAHGA